MPAFRYRVVDVFTDTKLEGNALAVFPDASALDPGAMQKIAKELNLSETTFVLPPTRADCAARVRIFTPANEMRFAGHPTIGTAWVLLDEGIVPRASFSLEEIIGPVPIRIDDSLLWLQTPPINFGRTFSRADCASMLGLSTGDLLDIDPQWVSAGNPNLYIALRTAELVDRASLDLASLRRLNQGFEPFCIFIFSPTPTGAYSRMFAPDLGLAEDPATGSATGPLAAYMARHHLCSGETGKRYVSEQGVKMGRRSLLHFLFSEAGIEVGGSVVPVASAVLDL